MRILSVEIAGFGPFVRRQRLDLEAMPDGLFLITGRTGAGKSSILDAICFALYGSVPRYEKAESRLRSDFASAEDPSEVTVRFSTAGELYEVTRTPSWDRPKRSGTGTTEQKSTARLLRLVDGEWRVEASQLREVGAEITRLLGLNREQFLQVVLLAQNRFQEFLRAGSDERQTVLRSLFDSERFDRVERMLEQRRRDGEGRGAAELAELERELARLHQLASAVMGEEHGPDEGAGADGRTEPAEPPVGPPPAVAEHELPVDAVTDWVSAVVAVLVERRDVAAASRERCAEDAAARADELTAAEEQRSRAEESRQLQAQMQHFLAGTEDRAARGELVARARSAESLRARVEQAAEAERAVAVAGVALSEALSAWSVDGDALGEEPPVPADEAEAHLLLDAVSERRGTVDAAREDERRLPELRASAEAARREQERSEARRALLDAEAAELPAARAAAERRLSAAALAAERLRVLDDWTRQLGAVRQAAVDRADAEEELATAVRREHDALRASTSASAAQLALFRARVQEQAGVLAGELRPGESCPVCGSPDHPSPAEPAARVSDDALERAREELERAEAERAAAGERARVAGASLAARTARQAELVAALAAARGVDPAPGSDGDVIPTLSAEIDAERAEIAPLAADAADAERERDRTISRAEGIEQERRTAGSDVQRAAAEAAAAAERLAEVLARCDAARGTAPSLSALSEALRGLRDGTQRLLSARRALAEAVERRRRAGEALGTAIAGSGFADAAAVTAALLAPGALAEAERRLEQERTEGVVLERRIAELGETSAPDDEELDRRRRSAAAAAERLSLADHARRALSEGVTRAVDAAEALRRHLRRAEEALRTHRVIAQLANTVAGRDPNRRRMRLESYVLAGELELIVEAANTRLEAMTSGRYRLVHDDAPGYRNTRAGLGLAVEDAHTGRSRSTRSLSGGESFLASLALALGLAEVVTERSGGVRLDTLFIDEGFGSLDAETLDVAMSTLDGLRAGGRTVGVISHVGAMIDQIPSTVRVVTRPGGDSAIEVAVR
ncbi:AAA family ATPase [Mycetocola reblochoni]|uniref:Nuclease SbcCD subunit C n=2 Tax=Mycetocola reblochoni TaxID=331618 RepID=A0A1R4IJK4_9MICO|nr:SMC family ATPase [Mycetocola reblochoni]RLP69657.1 SMC family ATPase [Mycetocola reblochoni]SJN19543.1 Exonuclease SbcC [Mycetocola reblochoni REB411]